MSKEDILKLEGEIIECLPGAMFRVKLDVSIEVVLGIISGRMRQNKIKILMGDRVEMEFSLYDLSRGRIVKRK